MERDPATALSRRQFLAAMAAVGLLAGMAGSA